MSTTELYALWHDQTLTVAEIAGRLGCTTGMVYRLADRHKLGARQPVHRAFSMEDAESPEEEQASAESLRLSPWVQRRIEELGIGVR